ncbi:MAG: FAD-dependent oxidoreductase [Actinomycetota bacterium]
MAREEATVDLLIVGAGAAGLATAWHLIGRGKRVTVLEPAGPPGPDHGRAPSRTWCWWTSPEDPFAALAVRRWSVADVIAPDGQARRLDLNPLQYVMVRSADLETWVNNQLAQSTNVNRRDLRVEHIIDGPDHAEVIGADRDGTTVRLTSQWVLDTRPVPPTGGHTHLLQHFRGWFVRASQPIFDPHRPILMDFRPPQPKRGVAFGYILPTDDRTALVEYTEFSQEPLTDAAYDTALLRYTQDVLGSVTLDILDVEQGVIPMTDATFTRRPGRRIIRAGTAGGATRPATGYTMSGARRQAHAIAEALAVGRAPIPPVPYPRRHLWMDAVLLRALDSGRLGGAEYLAGLFERHSPERVLRFLDGQTSWTEDLALMARSPWRPMVTSVLDLLRKT